MTLLVDGWWDRHEWWAVSLRKLAEASVEAAAAIERVVELLQEGPDCEECFERWMDEASGGRQVDDFPQALNEEHVIRILALEDAVLVRHGLEQWLVALGARRAREIERALAESREWAQREQFGLEHPF